MGHCQQHQEPDQHQTDEEFDEGEAAIHGGKLRLRDRSCWRLRTRGTTFLRVTTITDAVNALRRYQDAAPWRLAELVALGDDLLAAADAAPDKPTTERTLRFYVSRGVVHPPYGRGAGSSWGYRHLVELLAARLAQHGGETLDAIAAAREALGTRALERQVAERLGPAFFRPRLMRDAAPAPVASRPAGTEWYRIPVGDGAELHLAATHPLLADAARLSTVVSHLVGLLQIRAPET